MEAAAPCHHLHAAQLHAPSAVQICNTGCCTPEQCNGSVGACRAALPRTEPCNLSQQSECRLRAFGSSTACKLCPMPQFQDAWRSTAFTPCCPCHALPVSAFIPSNGASPAFLRNTLLTTLLHVLFALPHPYPSPSSNPPTGTSKRRPAPSASAAC